ncbi:MAG TPA: 30S ribosomal protein S8 [Candidatus Paceibacterota bacterium]|nr:30S ribosomal protein S8 [Candidatus Paceibacterota bacterium]
MITDPISDLIIRIQNASRAKKSSVSLPYSNMKVAVAEVLEQEGYIGSIDKKAKKEGVLSLGLLYKNGAPVVNGVKRISKPSRRMYIGVHDIKPVKRGYGLVVLSTPAGILSGKNAKAKNVGGEILFEIW